MMIDSGGSGIDNDSGVSGGDGNDGDGSGGTMLKGYWWKKKIL